MTRIDLLSDGRLLELLTQAALTCDPMPEVVVVRPALLVEVARRVVEGERRQAERQRRKEAASTPSP